VATLGRTRLKDLPPAVFVAEHLPAEAAVSRSHLLVSHGGSASSYVALAAGVPVLGLPSNLDQHLTMHHIVNAGAGLSLRAERATAHGVLVAARQLLEQPRFAESARRVADHFREWRVEFRFPAVLQREAPLVPLRKVA
jgi:UDP:flavonoid glycosyltransferase YjiC (YdhE family)